MQVIALPWLISCTLCDVLIAVALSAYLRKHKTGFAHTDTVVNKIIRCEPRRRIYAQGQC